MENRWNGGGGVNGSLTEENLLAILESSGCKDSRDVHEDKITFLEAVRAAWIINDNRTALPWKMMDAVLQILNDDSSLELTMASHKLLVDLEKCHPRVYLPTSESVGPASTGSTDLIVVSEAWCPLIFNHRQLEYSVEERKVRNLTNYIDAQSFFLLTQSVAQGVSELEHGGLGSKMLGKFLLFDYLIAVLEGDFMPRHKKFKETLDWDLLKECLLSLLLGSRRLNFKGLIRECLSIISGISYHQSNLLGSDRGVGQNVPTKSIHDGDTRLQIAAVEYTIEVCIAVKKLLTFIMELDKIKKEADVYGTNTRTDISRTSLVEIIVDELTYDKALVSPFLAAFTDPRWKLEIILQYFSKYCAKSSVRTRRSNCSSNDTTLNGVLKCFLNGTSAKGIVKKIGIGVVQLLLAHAFQAFLSVHIFTKHLIFSCANLDDGPFEEICKNMQLVFQTLKKLDKKMEILPFTKEALFTAATLAAQEC